MSHKESTVSSLASNNTNLSSISQQSNSVDNAYYNSEEYLRYYQQHQAVVASQQYNPVPTPSLPPTPLLSTVGATPLFGAGTIPKNGCYYTPEQANAYYENLAATNPEAYAAIYAQYYGTNSQTTSGTVNTNNNEIATKNEHYDDDYDDDPTILRQNGQNSQSGSSLPVHCNDKMGLNPLIFTNINQSPYFKTTLHQMKTYQEVIDEIYYSVQHLEPWERGSRNASGVTGMCGSVRGVSAGGIISTPFCILYKLYLLRLTKKQVQAMIKHSDSVFIRGLGFLYLRFTQQPKDLYRWFEPFFGDEDIIDPRAGGGLSMTIGKMCRKMLTRNEWFSTMLPRIPVPIQKEIDNKLKKWLNEHGDDSYDDSSNNSFPVKGVSRVDERHRNRDSFNDNDRDYESYSRRQYSTQRRDRNKSRSRSPYHGDSGRGSKSSAYRDGDDRGYRSSKEKYRSRDRY